MKNPRWKCVRLHQSANDWEMWEMECGDYRIISANSSYAKPYACGYCGRRIKDGLLPENPTLEQAQEAVARENKRNLELAGTANV